MESTVAVRVIGKSGEADGICRFTLAHADCGELPHFSAGAHIDVHLPGNLIRQYSLCGEERERKTYVIGVLRDPKSRGGSSSLHDAVHEGDLLTISLPRNHFPLTEDAPYSILFAGGIGVTPILSMSQKLASLDRSFDVHYCCRTMESVAFLRELTKAAGARLHLHLDNGPDEQRLNLAATIEQAPADTQFYMCGPAGFMAWVIAELEKHSVVPGNIHREYFENAAIAATPGTGGFTVVLRNSDLTYDIPEDRTIVEVLHQHGFELSVSCEQGVCGTCVTGVLDGIPDHRDLYFSDQERAANNLITPCCSRSKTPVLTLDL